MGSIARWLQGNSLLEFSKGVIHFALVGINLTKNNVRQKILRIELGGGLLFQYGCVVILSGGHYRAQLGMGPGVIRLHANSVAECVSSLFELVMFKESVALFNCLV